MATTLHKNILCKWSVVLCRDGYPRTNSRKAMLLRIVLVMRDWYTKLSRAVWTSRMTAWQNMSIFLSNCVILYGTPECVLTNNKTQFSSKRFEFSCAFLFSKPQNNYVVPPTNRHANRKIQQNDIRTIKVARHQRFYFIYAQLLTYTYNVQGHRSTKWSPFGLVLSPHPSRPTYFNNPIASLTDITSRASSHTLETTRLHGFTTMCQDVDFQMKIS